MKQCKNCKKEITEKRRAYCNDRCKDDFNKYVKPTLPKKGQDNDYHYETYNTNYGRPRGVSGRSGGWGIGPNVVFYWTELTKEKIQRHAPHEIIKLGSGNRITVGEARKMLDGKKFKYFIPKSA